MQQPESILRDVTIGLHGVAPAYGGRAMKDEDIRDTLSAAARCLRNAADLAPAVGPAASLAVASQLTMQVCEGLLERIRALEAAADKGRERHGHNGHNSG